MIELLQHKDSNLITLLYILSIFSNENHQNWIILLKLPYQILTFLNKKWWLLFKAKNKFPDGRRPRPGWLVWLLDCPASNVQSYTNFLSNVISPTVVTSDIYNEIRISEVTKLAMIYAAQILPDSINFLAYQCFIPF